MQRKTMFTNDLSIELMGSVIIDFSTEHDQYLPLILIFFFRTAALKTVEGK